MSEGPVVARRDPARCYGHALCHATAPELFGLDDDGYSTLRERTIPAGQEALATRAAQACPERAITIEPA